MIHALFLSAVTLELKGVEASLSLIVLTFSLSLFFILPIILFNKWFFYRRRIKKGVISIGYEPPYGLAPAEIGFIFDGQLGEREVGATVIHLIQRQALVLKKVDKSKQITRNVSFKENLKDFEKKIIEQIPEEGVTSFEDLIDHMIGHYSSGARGRFRRFVLTEMIANDLHSKGYLKDRTMLEFVKKIIKTAVLLAVMLVFVPAFTMWAVSSFNNGYFHLEEVFTLVIMCTGISILASLPLLLSAAWLEYLRAKILGRTWIATKKLKRIWPQIIGYRQFISLVEKDKLKYDSPQLRQETHNSVLPYAVVLGYIKDWRGIIS